MHVLAPEQIGSQIIPYLLQCMDGPGGNLSICAIRIVKKNKKLLQSTGFHYDKINEKLLELSKSQQQEFKIEAQLALMQ